MQETPTVLLELCARKYNIPLTRKKWERQVIIHLCDEWFFPKQPQYISAARSNAKKTAQQYYETGELPAWFGDAVTFLLKGSVSRGQAFAVNAEEIASQLEHLELSQLELYIAYEGLGWFKRSTLSELPTAEELAHGAKSYASLFKSHRLLPYAVK